VGCTTASIGVVPGEKKDLIKDDDDDDDDDDNHILFLSIISSG